jgi:hypothetical protein
MLDYLIATCLLLLIVGHGFLIRGCFKINENIPTSADCITEKIESVRGVLDEVADLLNEMLDGTPKNPITQTPSSPVEALLTAFLNRTPLASVNGYPQEQNEWEVLETDENP